MFINCFLFLNTNAEFSLSILVFPLLLILFFFAAWVYFFYFTQESKSKRKIRPRKYSDAQSSAALLKYFPYYLNLDAENRLRFLSRLAAFMQLKEFIPRQTAPNETLNLLISATAIQLTYGLDDFSLHSFDKILIYPDTYYSEIRNTHHKGEVNVPLRLIVLAAKHFLSGVRDPNDGINLGLYEMAHALNVHTFEDGSRQNKKSFIDWSNEALPEMESIKANKQHFLRQYAATNIEEMFAVCTENFFERPELFSVELPILYQKLMTLFHQDPRNHSRPIPESIKY